ncbi:hypothetical protein ACET3Z_031409 [Daucus carota]
MAKDNGLLTRLTICYHNGELLALGTGSLIQHQLVTHLTLGIALRAVLDALRNPSLKNFISPEVCPVLSVIVGGFVAEHSVFGCSAGLL